ncbi:MAG: prepilin peptidase [Lentimicrobiaceae bacterium]|nr:prepilin peptidase [Lentimicrobiaceae bacterium]
MEIVTGFLIFVLGMCFGSFINMLVYRTAVSYGLMKKIKVKDDKYSFCDYCGTKLSWRENIPLLSWVLQSGKTKCCQKVLPVAYPFVELLTGILFMGQFLILDFQLSGIAVVSFLIITLMIFSGVFDALYMILPDFSTLLLLALALVLNLANGNLFQDSRGYLWSTVGSGAFLGLLYIFTRGRGMGMGDVKLAFFMGALLGWPNILIAFYGAFISGAVYGLAMMATGRAGKKSLVLFGPFLLFGALLAWWFGGNVLDLFNKWLAY